MKRLELFLVLFVGVLTASMITNAPLRKTMLLAMFITSLSAVVHDAIARRKRGLTWNDVLADGSKLITGNVWLDGLLFAMIVALIFAILVMVLRR